MAKSKSSLLIPRDSAINIMAEEYLNDLQEFSQLQRSRKNSHVPGEDNMSPDQKNKFYCITSEQQIASAVDIQEEQTTQHSSNKKEEEQELNKKLSLLIDVDAVQKLKQYDEPQEESQQLIEQQQSQEEIQGEDNNEQQNKDDFKQIQNKKGLKQVINSNTGKIKMIGFLNKYQRLQFEINKDSCDLSDEKDLKNLLSVLLKRNRNKLEHQFIVKACLGLKIFQDYKDKLQDNPKMQQLLVREIKLEQYKKRDTIFDCGDLGNKYYIILKGEVSLLMPKYPDQYAQELEEKRKIEEDNKIKQAIKDKQGQNDEDCPAQSPDRRDNIFGLYLQNNKIYDEVPDQFKSAQLTKQKRHTKKIQPQQQQQDQENGDQQYEQDQRQEAQEQDIRAQSQSHQIPMLNQFNFNNGGSISQRGNSPEQLPQIMEISEEAFIQKKFKPFKKVTTVQQGQGFGEIALLTKQRRTGTMLCSTNVAVMTLSKQGFDNFVGAQEKIRNRERIAFLMEFQFFQFISSNKILSILLFIKKVSFMAGQNIFTENDQVQNIYFIRSGEIQLSKIKKNDNNYKTQNYNISIEKKKPLQRVPIALFSQNNYFGEQEIYLQKPVRHCQAKAITQVDLFQLDKDILIGNLKTSKQAFQIFNELAQLKLKQQEAILENIEIQRQKQQKQYKNIIKCQQIQKKKQAKNSKNSKCIDNNDMTNINSKYEDSIKKIILKQQQQVSPSKIQNATQFTQSTFSPSQNQKQQSDHHHLPQKRGQQHLYLLKEYYNNNSNIPKIKLKEPENQDINNNNSQQLQQNFSSERSLEKIQKYSPTNNNINHQKNQYFMRDKQQSTQQVNNNNQSQRVNSLPALISQQQNQSNINNNNSNLNKDTNNQNNEYDVIQTFLRPKKRQQQAFISQYNKQKEIYNCTKKILKMQQQSLYNENQHSYTTAQKQHKQLLELITQKKGGSKNHRIIKVFRDSMDKLKDQDMQKSILKNIDAQDYISNLNNISKLDSTQQQLQNQTQYNILQNNIQNHINKELQNPYEDLSAIQSRALEPCQNYSAKNSVNQSLYQQQTQKQQLFLQQQQYSISEQSPQVLPPVQNIHVQQLQQLKDKKKPYNKLKFFHGKLFQQQQLSQHQQYLNNNNTTTINAQQQYNNNSPNNNNYSHLYPPQQQVTEHQIQQANSFSVYRQ